MHNFDLNLIPGSSVNFFHRQSPRGEARDGTKSAYELALRRGLSAP
jgi:hypothetical protein